MWDELFESHVAARSLDHSDLKAELGRRIKELVKLGHLEAASQGRFEKLQQAQDYTYRFKPKAASKEDPPQETPRPFGWPQPLFNLPGVRAADLTIYAVERRGEVAAFAIRVEGSFEADGGPFLVSAELDNEPLGQGPRGHPLIHCHLGRDHDHKPQFRVPLPAMKPWDALDWMIAQITGRDPRLWTAPQRAAGTCAARR